MKKPNRQVGRYKKAVEETLLVKSDPFVSNLQCPKKILAHRNWEWYIMQMTNGEEEIGHPNHHLENMTIDA